MNDLTPMSQVNEFFQVDDNYRVDIHPGEFLIINAGVKYNSPASKFNHPNVYGVVDLVHEFKHYRRMGTKFWTSRLGRDFYFIVPKTEIKLIRDKGYSWVPVVVNGMKFSLNVSGGGAAQWVDSIRICCHTHCGWTKANLKKLAEVSWSPEQIREKEVPTFDLQLNIDVDYFRRLAALSVGRSKITDRSIFYLDAFSTVDGSKGPFVVDARVKLRRSHQSVYFYPGSGLRYRAKFSQIDWVKTCEANCWLIPEPIQMQQTKAA